MILKNAVMGWTSKAVNFLTAIIATPIFISYLGQSSYGAWLLLMNIWVLMALFDMGVFLAFTRFIAHDLANDDRQAALATAANSFSLYLLLSLAVLLAYLGVAFTAETLLNIPPEMHSAFRWALLPLGLTSALGLPSRVFEGVLFAREKLYFISWVNLSFALARVVITIWFLTLGWGLMGIALAHSLTTMAEYMLINWAGWREMPYKGWVRLSWHWPLVKKLATYARDTMFAQFMGRARGQAPSLLLGALASPAAVAVFGIGLRLLNHAMDLISALVVSAQPRFSSLESAGQYETWRAIFLRTTLYTSFIAAYLCLGILLLSRPFIHLWLGPDFALSAPVAMILAAPMGLLMSLYPCESVMVSLHAQGKLGWLCLAELALLLALAWFSLARWGALGAAWSLALSLLAFRPWWLSLHVCRRLGIGWVWFWTDTVGKVWLSQALAGLPLFFLLGPWTDRSWLHFLSGGLLLSALSGLLFWLVALDRTERRFWLAKLRRREAAP